MADINLLPENLATNKSAINLSNRLRAFSLVVFSLLFIAILSSVIIFFLYSRKLTSETNRRSELVVSLKALEETEQKIVLIKDRINKSQKLLSDDVVWTNVDNLIKYATSNENFTVTDINVAADDITFTIALSDSKSLTDIIGVLNNSGLFDEVTLNSVVFNKSTGYMASFALVPAKGKV